MILLRLRFYPPSGPLGTFCPSSAPCEGPLIGPIRLWLAALSSASVGVTRGHRLLLRLRGVGFRIWRVSSTLLFDLGQSAFFFFRVPDGVKVVAGRGSLLLVSPSALLLGQVAAQLMGLTSRDPYRGRGFQSCHTFYPKVRRRDGR